MKNETEILKEIKKYREIEQNKINEYWKRMEAKIRRQTLEWVIK